MPDHADRRCWPPCRARRPASPPTRDPERRRDDAVGEVLRQALDRRARHAGLVQRVRIAADDHRHRAPAASQARRVPARRRPRAHGRAGCAAPAGWRRAAARTSKAEPSVARIALRRSAQRRRPRASRSKSASAPGSAARCAWRPPAGSGARSSAGQPCPDPGDGMADRAVENVAGIPASGLDHQRGEGQPERQARCHGGTRRPSRRRCANWPITAAIWTPRGGCSRTRPTPWIDLSTGINPLPYPLPRPRARRLGAAAGARQLAALEAAAARRYGAAAGPGRRRAGHAGADPVAGAAAPRAAGRRSSASPMASIERAWRAAGASVETVDDLAALAAFDVAVVVNPNNPDGRLACRATRFWTCTARWRRAAAR